ncbi:high mobility group box domain-containing protein, partial [Fimicolochytrium jonesii]|uniref:high mobility group box domain-containing protein n=1 Tax=Fimicolochytrium jonesii TaxID=1396493 RepID=UPI0022FE32B9
KPYDPNAPKRPTNAFMFFCDETREGLRKERNEMKGAEIEEKGLSNLTKALGARWKSLNERERSDWRARFLTEVKRYDREMEEY